MPKHTQAIPEFLAALLEARSPTGFEQEAHAVLDRFLKPAADDYAADPLGNRIATLNPKGEPVLMLAGHMDELGFIVRHVDDDGFLYFDTLGGHDLSLIPGRRVVVLGRKGPVRGVTGKRAIHLMNEEDRKKVPKIQDLWIDIGASDRKAALRRVAIGDPAVYATGVEMLQDGIVAGRALDDKAGCYVVCEVLRRLASVKTKLQARLVSVATTQEEIGTRGAMTSSYAVNPHLGIAVDVGHATDHPDCDKRRHGSQKLGGGPILARGPNINPFVFQRLVECAERKKIPYQVEAEARPTGTDARVMQMARGGVAAGLISIPLRYMHTPAELVDLADIEHAVQLLMAFASSLKKNEKGIW